uniref:Uncharacterized protein n=1 Tax=Arundo donax TaxID=35708 RepID=A0A0A9GYR5_ARUDO
MINSTQFSLQHSKALNMIYKISLKNMFTTLYFLLIPHSRCCSASNLWTIAREGVRA